MFKIFPWNHNFETGIGIIDEQHKRLVDLLNQLATHLADCSERVTLTAVFSELANYADYHFKSEEEIWSRYLTSDDLYYQHAASHNTFLTDVLALQNNCNDENLDECLREIVLFLAKWLAFHILDADKKMAIACLAIEAGMSVSDARIHAENVMSGSIKVLLDTVLKMYDGLFNRTLDLMREKALRRQAEEALKLSEEHLRFLRDGGQEGVWEWNLDAGKTSYSQNSVQVAHILTQGTLSISGENKIHPDDLPVVLENIKNHLDGKTDFFVNKYRILSKDGLWRKVSSRGKVVERDEKNQPLRIMGTNTDITERELAILVYNHSSQGMFVADSDYQIININPAFTSITGFKPEEVIGERLSVFHHSSPLADAIQLQLSSLGYWEGEIDVPRKSGERYTAYFTFRLVKGSDLADGYLVALFTDISQIKKAVQQLWEQMNVDQLTQLPNRHQFNNHLQDEINKYEHTKAKFSLLIIDLDQFKLINDGLGYEVGDELLKIAVYRIFNVINNNGFVARMSGDEFSILLYNMTDGNKIERLMRQLLEQLALPYQLKKNSAYISASIGVAIYPDDADSASSLLKKAGQAMYSAKKQGRNRFCYFMPAIQEKAQTRQRLIADMHMALDSEQFKLYYQPIVDIKSGRLCKAEALVRWFHPDLGMINPVDFIPLAEETGLIIPLGEYIYKQAISQLRKWREIFSPSFQLSVNKSPIQFQQINRTKDWIDLLSNENVPGCNLIVEITEGVLMGNNDGITHRFQQFKESGIQLAIDDFGTGYSSLSYLNKLQVDFIKIDRSFVQDLSENPRNQALCEAMISMAHKLNIKVVAEGIETETQFKMLRNMDCDYAQGYLFSPPVPATTFENLSLNYCI